MNVQLAFTDDRERAVVEFWRKGHISAGTIAVYLQWVRRFRSYCSNHDLVEHEQLTAAGVRRLTQAYTGPRLKRRRIAQSSRDCARNALHAWACALKAMGMLLPPWRDHDRPPALPPLIDEYRQYRRAHSGVSEGTLVRDVETALGFLVQLRRAKRSVEQSTLSDVDAYVQRLARRVSNRTVADTCSSLRAFLRFLQVTGRSTTNLSSGVIAPRYRVDERPPRTLPWAHVQRIVRSVTRSNPPGKRDFAILLLLATYGLGAAEIRGLRLGDVDWQGGTVTVRRPKTKVLIELPLLPGIARALASYLRDERPPARSTDVIFLRKNMPYDPITSSAIRYRIRYYARLAGISARVLGAHAFRHSHASRQVDSGVNIKIVSDVLGHRSSSSTSIYVRVALKRLRTVALPVPR
jgi:integrase/recombinase XerD